MDGQAAFHVSNASAPDPLTGCKVFALRFIERQCSQFFFLLRIGDQISVFLRRPVLFRRNDIEVTAQDNCVLLFPVQECVRNHAAERVIRDHIQPHILGVVFKIRHAPEERFEPSRNVLFRFRARYALDRDQFLQDFKDSFFHIHIPL